MYLPGGVYLGEGGVYLGGVSARVCLPGGECLARGCLPGVRGCLPRSWGCLAMVHVKINHEKDCRQRLYIQNKKVQYNSLYSVNGL